MVERKATELLDEINTRLINIERNLKLQDFQQKLIINNFKKFFENKVVPDLIKNPQPKEEFTKPEIVPESLIDKKKKLMSINKTKSVEITPDEEIKGKLIPVTQRVVSVNGDPVNSADVKIFTTNNKEIKSIKSTTSGRWQTALPPGKYILKVSGKYNEEPIEYSQTFDVPNIDSPIDLPAPEIYKKSNSGAGFRR